MNNTDSAHGRGDRYLRRTDAAAYVTDRYAFPCSRQWLAKLAVVGGGPVFRKAGRYPSAFGNRSEVSGGNAPSRPDRDVPSLHRNVMACSSMKGAINGQT